MVYTSTQLSTPIHILGTLQGLWLLIANFCTLCGSLITYRRVVVDLLHGAITKVKTSILQVLEPLCMASAPNTKNDLKLYTLLVVTLTDQMHATLTGLILYIAFA